MELKKNPKKDLSKNRGLYFVSGLALIMMLAYVALEWRTYDDGHIYDEGMNVEDELIEEVPLTVHFTPPPPPPVAPTVLEVVDNEKEIEESVIESTETNQEEEIYEVEEIEVAEIEEDIVVPITAVEEKPIFPGCENEKDKLGCFQKMIGKHIVKNFRYPEIAQEMGIQGKVHMNFVIQKDGSIGNVQIIRSPDKNLGVEATRIIDKLPKMIPGKQSGKAVKVPFSLPIIFKLQ